MCVCAFDLSCETIFGKEREKGKGKISGQTLTSIETLLLLQGSGTCGTVALAWKGNGNLSLRQPLPKLAGKR